MATKLAVRASEAAELLSCDASTIRRYAQAGDLERIGSGRGTLYTMRSKEADRRIGAAIAVMMAERLLPTSFAAIATTRLTRREEWPAQRLDDAARVTEKP